MKDLLLLNEEFHPLKQWIARLAYSFMIALVTLSVLVLFTVIVQSFVLSPPVEYTPLHQVEKERYCPGDEFNATGYLKIKRQTILYTYISVVDENTNISLVPSDIPLPPQPVLVTNDLLIEIPFTIPQLSPGKYVRLIAFRGYNDSERPSFYLTPFQIGDNCE